MEMFESKYSGLRVLVVDDEQVLRTMIDYSLQAIGIRKITMASNGSEALLKMANSTKKFDLIVCDWRMPSMDGLEFLNKIRERNYRAKFLMLTSEASEEGVLEAMREGVDSYIVKPFTVDQLRKKISVLAKDLVD